MILGRLAAVSVGFQLVEVVQLLPPQAVRHDLGTEIEQGRRYNLVVGYFLKDEFDHFEVYVDGVLKHDQVSDAFFRSGRPFLKHGGYNFYVPRGKVARLAVHMSGYGRFSGEDSIPLARSHVGK